jgi:hypothetical protein
VEEHGDLRRLAADRLDQGTEDHQQAAPARVHDPRAVQYGELPRGGVQRGAGAGVRRAYRVGRGGVRGSRRVRRRAGDAEDGALHGVRDRLAGEFGGAPQGPGEVVAVADPLGHAAQELGQDRPRVPAGAEEGAVSHRPDHIGEGGRRTAGLVRGEHRFHGLVGRFDGQIQIRAGVPVRDGVHVDRVDLLALPAQGLQRQ